MSDEEAKKGRIVAVQGPVVDVRFDSVDDLPDLHETILTRTFDKKELILEVAEHLEGNIARCIALASTLLWLGPADSYAAQQVLLEGRVMSSSGSPLAGIPVRAALDDAVHRPEALGTRVPPREHLPLAGTEHELRRRHVRPLPPRPILRLQGRPRVLVRRDPGQSAPMGRVGR